MEPVREIRNVPLSVAVAEEDDGSVAVASVAVTVTVGNVIPDCVTVNTTDGNPLAENVIFPVREDVDVFAATLNVTLPFPLPDVVPSVSHDASFDTVHDVFDVTEMLLLELAAEPTDLLVGEIESTGSGGGVGPCVTVHTLGSQPVAENVILPVRDDVDVFAAALNVMLPFP